MIDLDFEFCIHALGVSGQHGEDFSFFQRSKSAGWKPPCRSCIACTALARGKFVR